MYGDGMFSPIGLPDAADHQSVAQPPLFSRDWLMESDLVISPSRRLEVRERRNFKKMVMEKVQHDILPPKPLYDFAGDSTRRDGFDEVSTPHTACPLNTAPMSHHPDPHEMHSCTCRTYPSQQHITCPPYCSFDSACIQTSSLTRPRHSHIFFPPQNDYSSFSGVPGKRMIRSAVRLPPKVAPKHPPTPPEQSFFVRRKDTGPVEDEDCQRQKLSTPPIRRWSH